MIEHQDKVVDDELTMSEIKGDLALAKEQLKRVVEYLEKHLDSARIALSLKDSWLRAAYNLTLDKRKEKALAKASYDALVHMLVGKFMVMRHLRN